MALIDQIMLAYHRKFAMTTGQERMLRRELEDFLRLSHDDQYRLLLERESYLPEAGID